MSKKRSRPTACDDLVFTEMLMTDPDTNSAFALAIAPDGAKSVVLLRKTPFKDEEAKAIIEVHTAPQSGQNRS